MKFRWKLTYQHFRRYFGDNLPEKEQHAFEKSMMQDTFESEAFDGLSQLTPNELEQDMADLQLRLQQKTQTIKRRIPAWFAYAASVIILVGIGTSLFFGIRYLSHETIMEEQLVQGIEEDTTPKSRKEAPAAAEPVIKPVEKDQKSSEEIIRKEKKAKPEPRKVTIAQVTDEEVLDEEEIPEVAVPDVEVEAAEPVANQRKMEVPKMQKGQIAQLTNEKEIPQSRIVSEQKVLEGQVAGVEVQPETKIKIRGFGPTSVRTEKRTILGKVLAQDRHPIPGAQVKLKGTNIQTSTNIDGEFQIVAPKHTQETLIASFIGCKPEEVPIGLDSNLVVFLEEDQLALNEVVVTGMGQKGKKAEIISAHPIGKSMRQYKKELLEGLDYTKLSDFPGTHRIKYSFAVEADGSLSDFRFEQVPNEIFEKEIIRTMKAGEKWQPQSTDGQPTASRMELTLRVHVD